MKRMKIHHLLSVWLATASSTELSCSDTKSVYRHKSCCPSSEWSFVNTTFAACSCPIAKEGSQGVKHGQAYWIIVYQGLTSEEVARYVEWRTTPSTILKSAKMFSHTKAWWSRDYSMTVQLVELPYTFYASEDFVLKLLDLGSPLPIEKNTHSMTIIDPVFFEDDGYISARNAYDPLVASLYSEDQIAGAYKSKHFLRAEGFSMDLVTIVLTDNPVSNVPENYDKELVHDYFQSQFYAFAESEDGNSTISLSSTIHQVPRTDMENEYYNQMTTNIFSKYPDILKGYTVFNLDSPNLPYNPLGMPTYNLYSDHVPYENTW